MATYLLARSCDADDAGSDENQGGDAARSTEDGADATMVPAPHTHPATDQWDDLHSDFPLTVEEVQDMMPPGWRVAEGRPHTWRSYPPETDGTCTHCPVADRTCARVHGTMRSRRLHGRRNPALLLVKHAWRVHAENQGGDAARSAENGADAA